MLIALERCDAPTTFRQVLIDLPAALFIYRDCHVLVGILPLPIQVFKNIPLGQDQWVYILFCTPMQSPLEVYAESTRLS